MQGEKAIVRLSYLVGNFLLDLVFQVSGRFLSTSNPLSAPKFFNNPEDAVKDIPNGAKVLVGGEADQDPTILFMSHNSGMKNLSLGPAYFDHVPK